MQQATNDIGPATNEAGQTATEYTLVLLFVSIAAAIALATLNDPFAGLVAKLVAKITSFA